MTFVPHEFTIGEVYFPPLLIAGMLGVAAAAVMMAWSSNLAENPVLRPDFRWAANG